MSATEKKSTAADVVAMLRRHYIADEDRPGGIFAAEIAAPGSNRRADLIWQGVTAASGHELVGHEVKVSRADVLAELADPTKSDPWQRYCDRWWLVVPHSSLVEGLDLPATWGVLTPPSGRRTRSCTVAIPAPQLTPVEQGPALRTVATWLHWKLNSLTTVHSQCEPERQRLVQQVQELREKVPAEQIEPWQKHRMDTVREIVRRLGDAVEDERVGSYRDGMVDIDDVVAALSDRQRLAQVTDDARRELRSVRGELRRLIMSLQRVPLQDSLTEAAS